MASRPPERCRRSGTLRVILGDRDAGEKITCPTHGEPGGAGARMKFRSKDRTPLHEAAEQSD